MITIFQISCTELLMLGTLPSFVNQPECATDIQDVTGDDFRGLDLNHDRIFRLDPNVRFFAPKFQVARCTAFSEMRLKLLKKREELVVAVAGPDFAEGSELGRSRLARVLHGDSQQEVADDAAKSTTTGVVA